MDISKNNIQQLLSISNDLIILAKKLAYESENDESVQLYGLMLDSAYTLKKAAEKWSEDEMHLKPYDN